jgi:hypothetical protein
MWLPLRLVLEFLGRSAAWLGVMVAIGAVAALLMTAVSPSLTRSSRRLLVAGGIVGALLGASLAYRFTLPEAFTFEVWRRSVPLAWSAGGALLGAASAALLLRRSATPPPS